MAFTTIEEIEALGVEASKKLKAANKQAMKDSRRMLQKAIEEKSPNLQTAQETKVSHFTTFVNKLSSFNKSEKIVSMEDEEQPTEILDFCLIKLQEKPHVDLYVAKLSGNIHAQLNSFECGKNAKLDIHGESSSHKELLDYLFHYTAGEHLIMYYIQGGVINLIARDKDKF